MMAPGLLVELQARRLCDDIGVLWPEEQEDGVPRVLLERAREVAQHRPHDLRSEWIEEINDEVLVGKLKLRGISMDGLDGPAPRASGAVMRDIFDGLLMKIGDKLDAEHFAKGKLRGDKEGAPFS